MKYFVEFVKGLWSQNPVFKLVLGMCPVLAVTTSVENAIGMGVAVTFVLACSNFVISLIRNIVPSAIRIPCYIIVIAAFVTVVDLCMNAYVPALHKSLGIFIPLIVVNCIILGRAEAFASKNSPLLSVVDGLGMGIGYMLALIIISFFREFLGNGELLGHKLAWDNPVLLMALAPGGFITLGLILASMNHFQAVRAAKSGVIFEPPTLDCRACVICDWGKNLPE
ncbi:MAG: electron transport complex subunit E [Lentisphaerae bacterium]|nr:electron transport complex subunit E [Lentisphaerota bacterium]